MPHGDVIDCKAMLSNYSQLALQRGALFLFHLMRITGTKPNHFSFTAILNPYAGLGELQNGTKIHALSLFFEYQSSLPVNNSLVDIQLNTAREVFHLMPKKVQIAWNIVIVSYNAILDAYITYMKKVKTSEAFNVFQNMPEKNVVSWTSMIAGFAKNGPGRIENSWLLYLHHEKLYMPDDFTFGAVLHACSILAVLGHGGLINMYAKFGDIKGSRPAFDDILDKDLVFWNTMLFGFGMHGLASPALQFYEDMMTSGIKPDKVTFIGLLMTCSHSGLIEKEAKELASKYSHTSGDKSISCEALSGACSTHWDAETRMYVGQNLKILETHNEMSCVVI
ncbi:hypothetical protein SLEP1_g224 [Rubroshorea leprosula]|uniref:Pentatricopeptide repeat-containing protein n=1 Tax=Rubroshorea leprosula TaxID=152421 RepID=A0AAV5H9M0_9ROSI|nr:hypothetical protein SLEP1_g224 [Rubroshorea leprosula]